MLHIYGAGNRCFLRMAAGFNRRLPGKNARNKYSPKAVVTFEETRSFAINNLMNVESLMKQSKSKDLVMCHESPNVGL